MPRHLTMTLGVLLFFGGIACAQTGKPPAAEQLYFSEDDPAGALRNQEPLPAEVLKILLQQKEVRDGLRSASPAEQDNPAKLFRASRVHLSGLKETDWVVMGVGPMSGADNSWFWLVRSQEGGATVVCFAGGNSLLLRNSRTNGFRDVESDWSSAAETEITDYHFDGTQYREWKTTRKNLAR
jgi:hypothetical protein